MYRDQIQGHSLCLSCIDPSNSFLFISELPYINYNGIDDFIHPDESMKVGNNKKSVHPKEGCTDEKLQIGIPDCIPESGLPEMCFWCQRSEERRVGKSGRG